MSRTININLSAWRGTVEIFDRLHLSQVELVEEALLDEGEQVKNIPESGRIRFTQLDKPKLPALLACVEKWNLSDFPDSVTVDTFPMTPRKAAHELIETIFDEIRKVFNGELQVPNG